MRSAHESVGIGLLYHPEVLGILEHAPDAVDFLSVTPDVLQIDRSRSQVSFSPWFGEGRFLDIEELVDPLLALAHHVPMVAHGVGLSIGSPGPLDAGYLARMREWVERLDLRWFSEHLSFFRLPQGSNAAHEAGLAAPLPFDTEVLADIAEKSGHVEQVLGVPFALENGVTYLAPVEDDLSEAEFLNGLGQRGTGLLLDLHNVYTNARNFDFDAARFVDEIDAQHVLEVHIAGGEEFAGMYTDAHAGAVPEPVWDLLERFLPRATALRGVTFEFHQSRLPALGVDGVLEQLARLRECITTHTSHESLHVPA